MKKKIISLFALLLLLSVSADMFAGDLPRQRKLAFSGFSGGMLLHAGWGWGAQTALHTIAGEPLPVQRMSGLLYGLGGGVRFHFGDHLRVGMEGYGTYMTYGEYSSRFKVGWGGALVDYQIHFGLWHPYAGVTIGGGSATNLTLMEPADVDFVTERNASYRKYSFMALAPFVGVDYELTPRIRLVLKADWLMDVSNRQPDFPKGPRIYVGFSFYHVKK